MIRSPVLQGIWTYYQAANTDNVIGPDLADASHTDPRLDPARLRVMSQLVHRDGLRLFTGPQFVQARTRRAASKTVVQATREVRAMVDELTAHRSELQSRCRVARPADREASEVLLGQVRAARDALFAAHCVLRSAQSPPPRPEQTAENFAQFWLATPAQTFQPLHVVWVWLLAPSSFGLVPDHTSPAPV